MKILKRHFTKKDIQTIRKHTERCSTSLAVRKVLIKSTMRYHHPCIRMTKNKSITKQLTIPSAGKNVEQLESSQISGWECQMAQPLWEMIWQFVIKLNIPLPNDQVISLLGIYPSELSILVPTKSHASMLIEALFVIAQNWKQPRLSIHKWINKL